MPRMRTRDVELNEEDCIRLENRERAFIAASRRCDRSLTARMRSAQRASDVHKERTGRTLHICEEDVANLETYEEEHDKMPDRHRHLTAGAEGDALQREWRLWVLNNIVLQMSMDRDVSTTNTEWMAEIGSQESQSPFASCLQQLGLSNGQGMEHLSAEHLVNALSPSESMSSDLLSTASSYTQEQESSTGHALSPWPSPVVLASHHHKLPEFTMPQISPLPQPQPKQRTFSKVVRDQREQHNNFESSYSPSVENIHPTSSDFNGLKYFYNPNGRPRVSEP